MFIFYESQHHQFQEYIFLGFVVVPPRPKVSIISDLQNSKHNLRSKHKFTHYVFQHTYIWMYDIHVCNSCDQSSCNKPQLFLC